MMKKFAYILIFLITNILIGQQKEYKIFNSEVNSRFAELGVTFLDAETVLFASSKKTENDKAFASNRRVNNRHLFLEFYFGKLNDSLDIIQTNRLNSEVFTKFNETDLAISPDRKTIYFCWNNYYTNQPKGTNVQQKPINLFKADLDADYNISNISPVRFNSKTYSIKSPSISKDGKKLFFISNMPGGYGNYDIYVSNILSNGTLSWPRNLGNKVNTSNNDLYPYTDKNNTLYFASYGHKGHGNLDIFKSEFINGNYTEVKNLPAPINSKYDDFGYVINPNGNSGFFVSNRRKGKGDVDIYGFKLIDKEIKCNQLITGLILNKDTKRPIANAKLTIYNKENEPIDSLSSAKDGSYTFKLNCNEFYKIIAKKEHYITNEISFETDDTLEAEINTNIELISIPCIQQIDGIVTDKLIGNPLENSNIKLYKNGEIISEKTTFIEALYNFELECESEYIIIASKEGYYPTEIKIKTDARYNKKLTINLVLSPLPCNQVVTGNVSNKLTGEPLINTDLKIYKNDKLVTTEKLRSRSNFRIELECEATYKIIAQKEGFLDEEIALKTDKQLNFIFTNNIELSPIECDQLISGTISNKLTKELINNVSLKLFNNDQLIDSQEIENSSDYNFNIECNKNYKIIAEKEGFETSEISLKTDATNKYNNIKNIELIPLPCNQVVSGEIINLVTGENLINVTLELKSNGNTIKSITTSNNSSFSFNLKCDETYTITANKNGFTTNEILLETTKEADLNFTKNIKLSPIECDQLITGIISNKLTKELLNNVSLKLFNNNQLIDSQEIENSSDFNFKIECNENYKIIAEKEGFETSEISLKTDATNKYNNIKNIELIPLPCNQIVSGEITNLTTGKNLINVTLDLKSKGKIIKTINTSNNSGFSFNLNCDDTYTITANKNGFITNEILFETTKEADLNFTKNIELSPIECDQLITGAITNKQTGEFLSNVTIKLFKNEQLIDSQLIENYTDYNFKVDCNENYKIIAEKEGFETSEISLKTDSRNEYNHNKKIALNPIICNQLLEGFVIDESTGNRLNNLQILLFQNDVLKEKIDLKTLQFKFNLDCNASYKILVEKPNYTNAEVIFTTDAINNYKIEKIIKIKPIECDQIVSGSILDKETNLPITSALITIYSKDVKVKQVQADANGKFKLELDCNLEYNITASSREYQNNSFIITPTLNYNDVTNKILYLNPQVEFKIVRNQKMVNTNPIYFGLDKSNITPKAAVELDKVVAILQNYPNIKIQTKSHTDSRGPDGYNLKLSDRRATSTISYIISKGIDPARIYGKGYGESELVNDCSNGVKCSEQDHQLNRRTEFIVIEE